METVADTGFIVALLNDRDSRHADVVPIYTQQSKIWIPQTVLTEVAYLVGRDAGALTVIRFLQGLHKSRFQVLSLTNSDLDFTADILARYTDSRIDFVDATVMAVAERLEIDTILTLDQRDFRIYQPQKFQHFTLLP